MQKYEKLESEELARTLSSSKNFQNYFNSVQLLKTTQERLHKAQENIENLEAENRKLLLRGSVAFTELTPRHSKIRDLFHKNRVKEPAGVSNYDKKICISTISCIDKLFAEIADQKEKVRGLKKQLQDKDKDKEKNSMQLSTQATQQTYQGSSYR